MHLHLPLFDWWSKYRPEWWRADIIAGVTAAAVVIPKSLAYATVAGLPIEVGMYTAIVPPLVYAVLGTSRALSVTTTSTIAILVAAELAVVAPGGDTAALMQATAVLGLLVGIFLMLASALRLGFFADFVSYPVNVGFKAGIGFVIVADQFPKLMGTHIHKEGFFRDLYSIVEQMPTASLLTVAVGVGAVLSLVVLKKFTPRLPAPLMVIGVSIAAAAIWALGTRGVSVVGAVPSGLPSFVMPDLSLAQALWPGALGIALMSFTETIAVGRAFAKTDEPPPRPNTELLATGAGNVLGAFLGSMPAGGGMSQTAVNRMSGALTPLAGVVGAAVAVLGALFLSPLIALMPQAALAAVVIVYSVGLIQPADFRAMLHVRRTEFMWAVAAMLGVMMLGTLKGIVVAIIVSLCALGFQVANPNVYVLGRKRGTGLFRPRSPDNSDDETEPGLLIARLEGRLFFLNAERVGDKLRMLRQEAKPRVVLLDLGAVFDLEYSALKMLTEAQERALVGGFEFWLAALQPEVLAVVQRSQLGAALGRERIFVTVEAAVEKYRVMHGGAATAAPGASHG